MTHKASTSKRERAKRSRRLPKVKLPKTPVLPLEEKAPAEAPQPAAQNDGPVQHHGPTRLDFDDRLIQGQTNKAGAVYLYERKELQVRSMVRLRDNFRPEIYDSVYGGD